MYQPKVSNTQKYKDHVVTKGKVIQISIEAYGWLKGPLHIVISETEEIEEGDKVYNPNEIEKWKIDEIEKLDEEIFWCKEGGSPELIDGWYKILALPEQFSDVNLTHGDEVLVRCTHFPYVIHLNEQNQITTFPFKQSLEELAKQYAKDITDDEGIQYVIENAVKYGASINR